MTNCYQQIYKSMRIELAGCKMNSPSLSDAESCYWAGLEYWELLKQRVADEPFESDEAAIFFFRHIKP